jgi:hypothetical protein
MSPTLRRLPTRRLPDIEQRCTLCTRVGSVRCVPPTPQSYLQTMHLVRMVTWTRRCAFLNALFRVLGWMQRDGPHSQLKTAMAIVSWCDQNEISNIPLSNRRGGVIGVSNDLEAVGRLSPP